MRSPMLAAARPVLLLALAATIVPAVTSQNLWETLPPTPELPAPISTELVSINGVQLWYQIYDLNPAPTIPIVMVHGGLGYSAYFADVIKRLVAHGHRVVALDRRGHGRSTFLEDDVFTFEKYGRETYELLQAIGVDRAHWVGWSDGAITTMSALMNGTIANSIESAFLFGGSSVPEETNATFAETAIFSEFVGRCAVEYAELQPNADFWSFATKVSTMEATLPQWTDADLAPLAANTDVIFVGAEYEEAVNLDVAASLQARVPGSQLRTLTGVSHFAPMQDPDQFTDAIEDFLFDCGF